MAENSKILLCHSFNSLSKISNFIMALDTNLFFYEKKNQCNGCYSIKLQCNGCYSIKVQCNGCCMYALNV
jgi:hypothetical protein